MSLAILQIIMGELITKGGSTTLEKDLDLSQSERDWLKSLEGSKGLLITCHIQSWWRKKRLKMYAPLTLQVLSDHNPERILDEYTHSVPCRSLFFVPEAISFLEYVSQTQTKIPHLCSIAQLEKALLIAKDAFIESSPAEVTSTCLLKRKQIIMNPSAAIVTVQAHPEKLIGSLLTRSTLPAIERSENFTLLIAPGLPNLWRVSTEEELEILSSYRSKFSSTQELLGVSRNTNSSIFELLKIKALIKVI
jgi:hypothetical protein